MKEKGVIADKILAITFTRNTANERINLHFTLNDSRGLYQHTIENADL
ncbi:MAG: hypothetical protein BWY67_01776 [Bacteroidetes bacterium ADurb.Bin397]|jgi:superfamily I DNA/RNA helicase|nr:MAG: hypothetical protein BWY67_01776 [Bacteroidetes bacterium ADurb.Bin397]